MMESLKITQEEASAIKEAIDLNSFYKESAGANSSLEISPSDLLGDDQVELARQKHRQREGFYERFSIETLLKFCLKNNRYEIQDGLVLIETNEKIGLPDGYGFKGGAARTILRRSLGLKNHEPRDYDLIRTLKEEPYKGADQELAQKFMEKDAEYGDGVEFISPDDYFQTRDFTINEVYVVGDKIFATEACIRDTLRGIIRVTDFELKNYIHNYEGLGPKMKAKSIRLYVEQLYSTGISEIDPTDKSEIVDSFINPFWIAVHLDRAFEKSSLFAEKFLDALIDFGVVPSYIKNVPELIDYLQERIEGDFYFRSVPKQVYEFEDDEIEGFETGQDLDEIEYWEKYFDKMADKRFG